MDLLAISRVLDKWVLDGKCNWMTWYIKIARKFNNWDESGRERWTPQNYATHSKEKFSFQNYILDYPIPISISNKFVLTLVMYIQLHLEGCIRLNKKKIHIFPFIIHSLSCHFALMQGKSYLVKRNKYNITPSKYFVELTKWY